MSNFYAEILEQIGRVKPVTIKTVIEGTEGRIADGMRRTLFDGVSPVTDPKGRSFARVTAEYDGETLTVCEPVMPKERLLVLGGGHIALPVCEFAAKCGFEVHIVDDRPEFANRSRFPDAAEVVCDSFENGIRRFGVTPFDYVVVITRGHRHDADCLRVLLPGEEPAYLGMIGSRRRTKGLLEMLKEEGFDTDRLGKICTPIGLDIGAITPAGGDCGLNPLRGHCLETHARARCSRALLCRQRSGTFDTAVSGRESRSQSDRHRNRDQGLDSPRRRCENGRQSPGQGDRQHRRRLQRGSRHP